jgi:hypothetical protein
MQAVVDGLVVAREVVRPGENHGPAWARINQAYERYTTLSKIAREDHPEDFE